MKRKTDNQPLAQREKRRKAKTKEENSCRGWLKNGNPPGDPNKAPRCNARSKRTGDPCRQPAMPNSKCRLHGGRSTGPRTPAGLERSRRGNWKHGEYSREGKEELKALQQGMVLFMNPDAIFDMSPVELRRHKAALDRLTDKLQHGLLKPYRQVSQ